MVAKSKQIVDLGSTKYMTSYKYSFDIHKKILLITFMEDNNIMQAIRMNTFVVKYVVKNQIKKIKLKNIQD